MIGEGVRMIGGIVGVGMKILKMMVVVMKGVMEMMRIGGEIVRIVEELVVEGKGVVEILGCWLGRGISEVIG